MDASFKIEKTLLTDADFDSMTWHDCPIRALSFTDDHKLLFDIDYIFKWVLMPNKKRYQFWIAPCTLIFENVYQIALETDHTTLIMDSISRENPQTPKNAEYLNHSLEYDWFIETTVGEISFKSVGYKQYIRKPPILINTQEIALKVRGGISFDTEFSSLAHTGGV